MRLLIVIALAFVALACEKTIKEARTAPPAELHPPVAQANW